MTSQSATIDDSQRIESVIGGTVIGLQRNVAGPKLDPPNYDQRTRSGKKP